MPALAIAVARRGVIVLHEAFGQLTPAPDSPPLPLDAIYPLASLSKPVTATAAMILVEEGRLGLNRPVAEYIPEFVGEGKAAVTVHHLLTHTSGLTMQDVQLHIEKRSQEGVRIPPAEPTQHPRLHDYLYLGYDVPLSKAPGSEMTYADYNFDLLGEIVRRVSGKALGDFAQERLFEPLGMHNSWYSVPESASHRVVKRPPNAVGAELDTLYTAELPPYIRNLFGGLNSRLYQELPWGCDGVFSTAMDMARFGQMFLNRGHYGEAQILSPATVAAMTRNQIPGISANFRGTYFPEASWGLGWDVLGDKRFRFAGSLRSPRTFSHAGLGGVLLWVDPVYEIVGAYLATWLELTAGSETLEARDDLFMNAVTAAVIEE
jgi:CubicO group peptidase (beta-lactamase class C family)